MTNISLRLHGRYLSFGILSHAAALLRKSRGGFTLTYICKFTTFELIFGSGCFFITALGTEELGHLEMIGALVHQLTRNLKDSQIENSGFAPYFVDHTAGVYPTAASGFPWSAASIGVKGDPIADLTEDLAAEATFCYALHFFLENCRSEKSLCRNDFSNLDVGNPLSALGYHLTG